MNYSFSYKILDYTKNDVDILFKKFIPNLIDNSINQRSTLDSVSNVKVDLKGVNLVLQLDVVSNSPDGQLDKSIHGGLGNTFGKGRVIK